MKAKLGLDTPPKFLRSPVSRGILLAASDGRSAEEVRPIDPEGGDEGAGLIRGMAVITRGEALGHGLWIDAFFLQQVANQINASAGGIKQRFTHPGLSGDGLGKHVGKAKNAIVDGDVVRADSHISKASHKAPDGDLGDYVMQLGMDNPEDFGCSIAFDHDSEAETQFLMSHGATVDEYGCLCLDDFVSPDPDNICNLPHCRLKDLKAVDVVDDPAANPSGLFHSGQEIPTAAEQLLTFALGLSSDRPTKSVFDIHPDRAIGFVQRFLDRHGLAIQRKEAAMSEQAACDPEEKEMETSPAEETPAEDEMPAEEETPDGEDPVPEKPGELSEGQRFIRDFGTRGAVLFAVGKTYQEAQSIILDEQRDELAKLRADHEKLLAANKELRGDNPVSFSDVEDSQDVTPESKKLNSALGKNLGKFAASIKLPGHSNN